MVDRLVRLCEEARNMSREELLSTVFLLAGEYSDTLSSLKEQEGVYKEMTLQYGQMKAELEGVKRDLASKIKLIDKLNGQLHMSKNDQFGRSSEKMEDAVASALNGNAQAQDPTAEDAEESEKKEEPSTVTSPADLFNRNRDEKTGDGGKKGKRTNGKRMKDLDGLCTVKDYVYDPEELERLYGSDWYIKEWSVTRSYEAVKASIYVKEVYKPVLAVGTDHMIVRIPNGNPLLKGSLVSSSMGAMVMYNMVALGLPFYRQSQDLARDGVNLSRQTMSYWAINLSDIYLRPVYDMLCTQVCMHSHNQVDETHWTVINDGRRAGSVSYIWAHVTSELLNVPPVIVYCFELTRGTDHLRNFYGNHFKGNLTSDGYVAYPVYESETDGEVTVSGCLAHCRRYFWYALLILNVKGMSPEQVKSLPEIQALFLISEIYRTDEPLKKVSAEERAYARDKIVRQKVDAFFGFIDSLDIDNPSFSAKLVQAITYARNQKERLVKFLDDPYIPIDNSNVERKIRPVSTIRRNSLFSYSTEGADAFVIVLSLVETAKANEAHPYYYLKYLLEKMPEYINRKRTGSIEEWLLPWSKEYKAYEEEEIRRAVRAYSEDFSGTRPTTADIKAQFRQQKKSA